MREIVSFRPELRDYLSGGAVKSILLVGDKEMGILKDAIDMASVLLSSENPELCQDYMFIGLGEDKKSLGVDDAEAIIQKSLLLPAAAAKQVIVVDGFNKMTIPAQNKLLKLIEESKTVTVIAVAYEDTAISTIKSRMTVVRYAPLSVEQFLAHCKENGIDEPLVMYYLTGGIVENIETVDRAAEVFNTFAAVRSTLEAKGFQGLREVLSILHMVKEKDRNAFFENHRDLAGKMLSLIAYSVIQSDGMSEASRHLLDVYRREVPRLSSPSYTKDDFMGFFVEVI